MAGEFPSIGGRTWTSVQSRPAARTFESHPIAAGCCASCDALLGTVQTASRSVRATIPRPVNAPGGSPETRLQPRGEGETRAGDIVRLSSSGKVVRAGQAPQAEDTRTAATGAPKEGAEKKARLPGQSELPPEEAREVEELRERDKAVRAHEQAHKSAAGQHAGAVSLTYKTGPDGQRYAVGGEVPVDLSPVRGDPGATVRKMMQIRRAALAPADPSAADRAAAAQAASQQQNAQADLAALAKQRMEEAGAKGETKAAEDDVQPAEAGRSVPEEGRPEPEAPAESGPSPMDPAMAPAPATRTSFSFYA